MSGSHDLFQYYLGAKGSNLCLVIDDSVLLSLKNEDRHLGLSCSGYRFLASIQSFYQPLIGGRAQLDLRMLLA